MRRIKAYEIDNMGQDHAQYFQGAGISFTDWEDVAVGVGSDAKEAYEDAVDSLAQNGWDADRLPTRPRGIRKDDRIPADANEEWYCYVAVRVR
jgi:hypothetical protein